MSLGVEYELVNGLYFNVSSEFTERRSLDGYDFITLMMTFQIRIQMSLSLIGTFRKYIFGYTPKYMRAQS